MQTSPLLYLQHKYVMGATCIVMTQCDFYKKKILQDLSLLWTLLIITTVTEASTKGNTNLENGHLRCSMDLRRSSEDSVSNLGRRVSYLHYLEIYHG